MKKILLLGLSVLTASLTFGQSAHFINPQHVATGTLADGPIEVHWNVQNISGNTVTIEVAREVISQVTGSTHDFCWTYCYPTHVDTSIVNVQLTPNEIDTTFAAHYNHNGNAGETTVRYHFYDENHPSDINSYDVIFCIGATAAACNGVGINEFSKGSFEEAYPNPSNGITNISYTIDASASSANLVVYNMLGEKVADNPVKVGQGFIVLNTSDFNQGTYFYSLLADGEILGTKKLIVNR